MSRLLETGKASVKERMPNSDDTPLHYATHSGREMLDLILNAKPELDVVNVNGFTPLQLCAHFGLVESALVLLKAGASPEITNKYVVFPGLLSPWPGWRDSSSRARRTEMYANAMIPWMRANVPGVLARHCTMNFRELLREEWSTGEGDPGHTLCKFWLDQGADPWLDCTGLRIDVPIARLLDQYRARISEANDDNGVGFVDHALG